MLTSEIAVAAVVALDNDAFMSLPDTNRDAIVSGMCKIYTAEPAEATHT